MRLLLVGLMIACGLLADGNVAGKWKGTIFIEAAEQDAGKIPAFFVLEQAEGKITGTAGGDEANLIKISTAKLEGDKLTIEVSPSDVSTLRFTFTLKDDTLEGGVEENGRSIGKAKVSRY